MSAELVHPKRWTKAAAESRRFWIDFQGMEEFEDGDSWTGAPTVSVSPAGPTLSNEDFEDNDDGDSTRIAVDIAGGTVDTSYLVRLTGTLTSGAILSRAVYLDVKPI